MRSLFFTIPVAALLVAGCDEAAVRDTVSFTAPDSLGRTLVVSRQTSDGAGEVTFLSFGSGNGNIRLVTYFSDGSSMTEPLAYNSAGELQAIDGAPRLRIQGNRVERLPGYSASNACIGMNVTPSAPTDSVN